MPHELIVHKEVIYVDISTLQIFSVLFKKTLVLYFLHF